MCSSGHGPQFDCADTSAPAGPVQPIVAGLTLLLAAAAGGIWLRLRQRPREAI